MGISEALQTCQKLPSLSSFSFTFPVPYSALECKEILKGKNKSQKARKRCIEYSYLSTSVQKRLILNMTKVIIILVLKWWIIGLGVLCFSSVWLEENFLLKPLQAPSLWWVLLSAYPTSFPFFLADRLSLCSRVGGQGLLKRLVSPSTRGEFWLVSEASWNVAGYCILFCFVFHEFQNCSTGSEVEDRKCSGTIYSKERLQITYEAFRMTDSKQIWWLWVHYLHQEYLRISKCTLERRFYCRVYPSSRAIITMHYRLSGLNSRNQFSHSSEG